VDVDVEEDNHTALLLGAVPTAGQKAAAERLAKKHAHGYKIKNMLVVMD
jgi:hypothetical protein